VKVKGSYAFAPCAFDIKNAQNPASIVKEVKPEWHLDKEYDV
jgi:hypothetical protein